MDAPRQAARVHRGRRDDGGPGRGARQGARRAVSATGCCERVRGRTVRRGSSGGCVAYGACSP
eukprot:1286581-Prymnesium_polylepis.1